MVEVIIKVRNGDLQLQGSPTTLSGHTTIVNSDTAPNWRVSDLSDDQSQWKNSIGPVIKRSQIVCIVKQSEGETFLQIHLSTKDTSNSLQIKLIKPNQASYLGL